MLNNVSDELKPIFSKFYILEQTMYLYTQIKEEHCTLYTEREIRRILIHVWRLMGLYDTNLDIYKINPVIQNANIHAPLFCIEELEKYMEMFEHQDLMYNRPWQLEWGIEFIIKMCIEEILGHDTEQIEQYKEDTKYKEMVKYLFSLPSIHVIEVPKEKVKKWGYL